MFSEESISKDCILLEPPMPIKECKYLCDKYYHTEFIEDLYKNYDIYGIIIIGGEEIKLFTICGTEIKNINRDKVRITKNHNKGGQSAPRFGRIRDNEIQQYIAKSTELATENFMTDDIPVIKGLIIAGNADKKDKLYDVLHQKLKEISHVISISEKDDIQNVVDKCKYIFESNDNNLQELNEFFEYIDRDNSKAIYGNEFVINALNEYKLQKLLVHEHYENKNEMEIICKNVSCQYVEILNIDSKTDELLKGYGGIVGIAWY
jgi:peptide chain release factor subunit 1